MDISDPHYGTSYDHLSCQLKLHGFLYFKKELKNKQAVVVLTVSLDKEHDCNILQSSFKTKLLKQKRNY